MFIPTIQIISYHFVIVVASAKHSWDSDDTASGVYYLYSLLVVRILIMIFNFETLFRYQFPLGLWISFYFVVIFSHCFFFMTGHDSSWHLRQAVIKMICVILFCNTIPFIQTTTRTSDVINLTFLRDHRHIQTNWPHVCT